MQDGTLLLGDFSRRSISSPSDHCNDSSQLSAPQSAPQCTPQSAAKIEQSNEIQAVSHELLIIHVKHIFYVD